MDSLSSVSPSFVLPPGKPLRHHHHRRRISVSSKVKLARQLRLSFSSGIPRSSFGRTSDNLDRRRTPEAYLLEANPWRETSKPVYVLTHRENQLCTMKTRRNQSEVERELGLLFSKGGKWRNQAKQTGTGTKFQMVVEDVREGVLVFEDGDEAVKYCDLLQGGGQNCEGVAEIEASSVFDLCRKMRALAVLFRRGRTPPRPENLKLNLRARKHSLEDQ
nr:uncharacterized protein LOC109166283 [Ipomoea batatas]